MELSIHIQGTQVKKHQPSEKSNLMLVPSEAYVFISDPAIESPLIKREKESITS